MDIQKFETAYLNAGGKASELDKEDGEYVSSKSQMGWQMWQAAQAVPEGFNFGLAHDTKINDPKELLFRCLRKMKYAKRFRSIPNWVHVRDFCELGSGTATRLCLFLNVDPDSNEFKLIEAQEQSHE